MAGDLGSSVRTVRRAIEQLTTLRWFEIKRGCGRGHSNVYSPNFEKVTDLSPFPAQAAGSAERVTELAVKGDTNGRERVTDLSPESPLRKPIEEPFETRDARARDGEQRSDDRTVEPTNYALLWDRGGSSGGAQGHMMLPIQGGHQKPTTKQREPDWKGWAARYMSIYDLTREQAWLRLSDEIDTIAAERGIGITEAGAIHDRELKKRRKLAA